MPRVIAIIPARTGSSRLPRKHLRSVAGKPLLGHMIERVRRARHLDGIVVAIPESSDNDALEALCTTYKVACFRGSEGDVLSRMIGALEHQGADAGVIVYGDGFLIDPAVIDLCVKTYLADPSYDFVGNDLIHTFPSGMFVETVSLAALKDADRRTNDPAIREHGTFYVRQNPQLYKQKNFEAEDPLRRPDIHLDVDTEDDLKVMTAILEHFAPRNDFSAEDILCFLDENPAIPELNRYVHRRWKRYQHPIAK